MTSGPLDSLDSLLATLSGETWERLRDAMNLSVSFGEETITDLLALDINRMGLKTTTFEQISRPVEAYIGTDYEWWVGHDHIGWIRLAVQAKFLAWTGNSTTLDMRIRAKLCPLNLFSKLTYWRDTQRRYAARAWAMVAMALPSAARWPR